MFRLIKSSSRSTAPCSSTSLARPGEKISLSNPLALLVVKGSQRLCRRRQASRPSPDPEPTRMSNDSPSMRVMNTVYNLICKHSQSVQRHHNFCCCIGFCHCCRFSFHGPRQDISRSRVHTHDEVLCTSCPRYELILRVLQRWRLSYPPRSDWFVLDLLRPTLPIPLSAQESVANLTRLG